MVAKLRACEHALAAGVDDVVIVDGRSAEALVAAATSNAPASATIVSVGDGLKTVALPVKVGAK
jgi:acetylglutamate kinase